MGEAEQTKPATEQTVIGPPTLRELEDELLIQAGADARQKYAMAKLHYQLATSGAKGYEHPNTAKATVESAQKQLGRIEALIEAGEGIPPPTSLEVAGGLEVATVLPDGPQE
jgi:hypothetical protein